jgi:hypothetical protein
MNIDPSLQAFMNPYFPRIETTKERTDEELRVGLLDSAECIRSCAG